MKKGMEFNFFAEWVKFGDSLQDEQDRLDFYMAISRYGVYGEEPEILKGASLEYFNENVRPNIDNQHRRANHGKV
ncbi:MAG: hypothetical protein J6N70_16385 [Oribacterium sp.]|jgi:hypothetical protein|nr:hypothetical protein [Oribacterium sp.]